jgi:type IV pilus assembly protein PilA
VTLFVTSSKLPHGRTQQILGSFVGSSATLVERGDGMSAAKTESRGDRTVRALPAQPGRTTLRRFGRSFANAGFTLVELMIVVAIVGVLAVIAIVGYNKYVRSAASGEARAMLQSIRGAEDNFKAETLNYMSCPLTGNTFAAGQFYPRPLGSLDSKKAAWVQPGVLGDCYTQLNVKSSGPVRYSFSIFAGPPGNITAPQPTDVPPGQWPFLGGATTANPWFVAVGEGDYDGDGKRSVLYVSSEMADVVAVTDNE